MQLKHPSDKKAISMDIRKYDVLKKGRLFFIRIKGESTRAEILQAITEDFKLNKTVFEDYWNQFLGGQGPAPGYLASLTKELQEEIKKQSSGKITFRT